MRECTPALFNQVVDASYTARVCAEIEDALEKVKRGEMSRDDFETFKSEQKKRLAIFTPHATFPKGRRVSGDAVPSGLSMYDVDHIGPTPDPSPKGEGSLYQKLVEHTLAKKAITDEGMIGELKRLGICLVHVTPSTEGFRLFFVVPEGMSLEQAQRWMSEQLGDADYDGSVKDMARCSFVVPRDYILFEDEKGLFRTTKPTQATLRTPSSLPLKGEGGNPQATQEADSKGVDSKPSTPRPIGRGRGEGPEGVVSPSPRTLFIFDECMKEAELTPEVLIVRGHRHEALKSILSVGATQLLKKEELMGVLQVRMPDNWQDENIQTLVNDFYAKYHDDSQKMTAFQRKTLARSLKADLQTLQQQTLPQPLPIGRGGDSLGGDGNYSSPIGEAGRGPLPIGEAEGVPPIPKRLPPLIKLLTSRTPDVYKPAVAHAVFPSLAAHLWKVRFRYINNVEHEATLMNVLMAGTGAGKDCITEPINRIMADIRRRDDENLEREKEWKKLVNSKGSNKDKAMRPEGLIIQEIDADVTNAAFVQRMAEADEHFLYVILNEIEQFDALKGNGRGGQQFQIMCLAFDHNHRYGQTRVGVQSVTEKVTVRFNWNASTTIQGGQQYFRNVLTKGPISRINFCTIPEREIGADMPVYGTYDAQFDEELRLYLERLTAARGLIDCPQAFKLAKTLKNECAEFSRLSQSRVYENLSFRALVIAYLKACVLYVAHGNKWDKTMEDFIRWSLHYDLWCKMQFFGEAIEQANNEKSSAGHRGPRNLLELLPNEFTMDDALRVRREQGLSRNGASDMIRVWRNRGYIEERTDEQLNSFFFVKLKYKNVYENTKRIAEQ